MEPPHRICTMNRDDGGGREEKKRGSFSSRPRILCQTSLAVQDGAKTFLNIEVAKGKGDISKVAPIYLHLLLPGMLFGGATLLGMQCGRNGRLAATSVPSPSPSRVGERASSESIVVVGLGTNPILLGFHFFGLLLRLYSRKPMRCDIALQETEMEGN